MNEELPFDDAIAFIGNQARQSDLEVEVLGVQNRKFTTSFQKQQLDKFDFSETHQLGVRVVYKGNEGLAYTEQTNKDSLTNALEEARTNAGLIENSRPADLVNRSEFTAMPELYNENLSSESVTKKMDMGKRLEATALERNEGVQGVPYNAYGDFWSRQRIWNSRGLDCEYQTTGCYLFAFTLAKNNDDSAMGLEIQIGRSLEDLDPVVTGQNAADKALQQLGAGKPTSGQYPVVFAPEAVQDLFEMIEHYFSAQSVFEKTSPFANKLGNKVFSSLICLEDNPFEVRAFGSRPFDDEGSPSQKTTVVKNGVLESFLTNSTFADNPAPTANAARSPSSELSVGASNLCVQPGSQKPSDLLNSYPEVLHLTRIKGRSGFNSISGNFSVESEGAFYKNGAKSRPLANFVLSGNILDVLQNVEGVGSDLVVTNSSIIAPSLLVPQISVAGE